jgi:hypothetical protein
MRKGTSSGCARDSSSSTPSPFIPLRAWGSASKSPRAIAPLGGLGKRSARAVAGPGHRVRDGAGQRARQLGTPRDTPARPPTHVTPSPSPQQRSEVGGGADAGSPSSLAVFRAANQKRMFVLSLCEKSQAGRSSSSWEKLKVISQLETGVPVTRGAQRG